MSTKPPTEPEQRPGAGAPGRAHVPRNVNLLHQAEQATASLNEKLALALTKGVGTMLCAYCFALLALIGFPGFQASPQTYVQWVSQTFIQLVMLSVIMVGQSVLGRKQELQADEQYRCVKQNFQDTEAILHQLETLTSLMQRQGQAIEAVRVHLSSVPEP